MVGWGIGGWEVGAWGMRWERGGFWKADWLKLAKKSSASVAMFSWGLWGGDVVGAWGWVEWWDDVLLFGEFSSLVSSWVSS